MAKTIYINIDKDILDEYYRGEDDLLLPLPKRQQNGC